MAKYVINPSPPLSGAVAISGAKNAALPAIAAALLSEEKSTLKNLPDLDDVSSMLDIIRSVGGAAEKSGDLGILNPASVCARRPPPYEIASRLRASFLITGPLLARTGRVKMPLPGGCAIGTRPVDLHLKGFAAMGAKITTGHGFVELRSKGLGGAKIYLDFPSVGATENILMAACLAKGQTIIENAATEPELVDLANLLNAMGADVKGAGTDNIRIRGVKALAGATHSIIPDRIEAGTFMVAAAVTGGEITLEKIVPEHLKPIIAKMREAGAEIDEGEDFIKINASGRIKSADIKTLPFPGFPTDMQAQLCTLMSVANGTSIITETVFENRFMHIGELKRMGANIKIEGRAAIIEGKSRLTGAPVTASDLRAGAALAIAGLKAEGETEVSGISHIRRGYANFEGKLAALGANISLKS